MHSNKQENDEEVSLPDGDGIGKIKPSFGKYSDPDMLSWIQGLALDPCVSGASWSSIEKLWNQTLIVRRVMALCCPEYPWRKRLLPKFVNKNYSAEHGWKSQTFNQEIVTTLRHGLGSLLTSRNNFQGKQVPIGFSHSNNAVDSVPPNKDSCPLLESDELEPNRVYLRKPRQSIRLSDLTGDHLRRMVIPVAPLFQADIPDWIGPANTEKLNGYAADSETLKWLGTQTWPTEVGTSEATAGEVGKGRSNSCSCVSPRSPDCKKCHIVEERLRLQSHLGPAFLSWKFDEMGEEVSKSWTLKEQESFESLTKLYPLSKGTNFLEHALSSFPSKSAKSIFSYYFNVFIPRRMSLHTTSSVEQVDSDGNVVEANDQTDSPGKTYR